MKPINPIKLADVTAGIGGRAGDFIIAEVEKDPRLMELYWYVQAVSRHTGGLEALLERIPGSRDARGCVLTPKEQFVKTLNFLAGDLAEIDIGTAGLCPAPIAAAIYKLMDADAKAVRMTLADTKVSRTIFKELDLALQHKVPVPIIGDSRFGKTKGLSVWCEMRPERARLVTVPESNREWDFFAAHADACGIEYNDRTPTPRLKRAVEWVIHQVGFFICYDEAHFLVPLNYYKDTPPKRINWVRCQVIDKGIGCAFFATPQSMHQTLERFAAKTKYNFEQWLGRLAPPVVLADYYDRDELMAVANVHFPDFPEKLLALICARAMQSEGYLKSMEFTARYASALARDRQHKTPTLQDVEESIERMMPKKVTSPEPVEKPSRSRSASSVKPAFPPLSDPVLNVAGTDRTENFTSRRPGITADQDTTEPIHADRALAPA